MAGGFNGPTGNPLTLYYTYDNSGRQATAYWGNGSTTQNLVQSHGMTYDGAGAIETTLLSNQALETVGLNKRLQPSTRLVQGPAGQVLFHLVHSYARPTAPNLNGTMAIWSVSELTPGYTSRTQNYGYDPPTPGYGGRAWLNRITSAASPGRGLVDDVHDGPVGQPDRPDRFGRSSHPQFHGVGLEQPDHHLRLPLRPSFASGYGGGPTPGK